MSELDFLKYMQKHDGTNPLSRNLMNREAEKLVKVNKLNKGTSIDDGRVKIYYV